MKRYNKQIQFDKILGKDSDLDIGTYTSFPIASLFLLEDCDHFDTFYPPYTSYKMNTGLAFSSSLVSFLSILFEHRTLWSANIVQIQDSSIGYDTQHTNPKSSTAAFQCDSLYVVITSVEEMHPALTRLSGRETRTLNLSHIEHVCLSTSCTMNMWMKIDITKESRFSLSNFRSS